MRRLEARELFDRHQRAASRLRRFIAQRFGGGPAGQIILTPSLLVALRLVLNEGNSRTLVLSDREYYHPSEFPGWKAVVARPEDLVKASRGADAVILSLVSWRGQPSDVRMLFDAIRDGSPDRPPILIVDYTHAGAIGFPPMSSLSADVVLGDVSKWLLPPGGRDDLAFVWVPATSSIAGMRETFASFFLAVSGQRPDRCYSRWLNPASVESASIELPRRWRSRQDLKRQHDDNLMLAARASLVLKLPTPSASSVLWLGKNRKLPGGFGEATDKIGLLKTWPDGSRRLVCRSDVRGSKKAVG